MEFLIISGMSGAGKSKAAASLEDLGFYCVDNMPPELLPKFAEICLNSEYKRVVLVIDIRTAKDFDKLFKAIYETEQIGCTFKILFLDASNNVLLNRYKETRRKHPMDNGGVSIAYAIEKERELLEPLRNRADFNVDTSSLSTSAFRSQILQLFLGEKSRTLSVNILSFGFKNGVPQEADLMFDVRFLPNPYYDISLREKTGIDKDVSDFVFENGIALKFMEKICDLTDFLIPKYIDEGKISLVIAIGCTGGKHRSVAISEKLSEYIAKKGYNTIINHRDIGKI